MTNRTWYRYLAAFVLVVIGLTLAAAALAQTGVEIPLDRIHRGEPGDRFLEAEISATNEIGWTCGAFLERFNNESTHAKDGHPEHGTNLIVESGTNGVTFANIESEAFEEATRVFVLDGDIKVYTQIGEDGVSSMGFLLEFECNPPTTTTTSTTTTQPGTTTTTPSVTTTTAPPASTTTTTEPPPINGIDTGFGGCADGACDPVVAVASSFWSAGLLWMALGIVALVALMVFVLLTLGAGNRR